MLSRCFLNFSVCVGAFVIGLSQISSFFSFFSWFSFTFIICTNFWNAFCPNVLILYYQVRSYACPRVHKTQTGHSFMIYKHVHAPVYSTCLVLVITMAGQCRLQKKRL